MKLKQQLLFSFMATTLACSLVFSSCRKDNTDQPADSTSMSNLKVDPAFTFETSQNIGIQVTMLDNNNGPVPGMRVDIYTAAPDNGGVRLLSGITDAQGKYSCDYKIPAYLTSLAIGTTAIGFVNMQTVFDLEITPVNFLNA